MGKMVFPDGTTKEGLFENNIFIGGNHNSQLGYASGGGGGIDTYSNRSTTN